MRLRFRQIDEFAVLRDAPDQAFAALHMRAVDGLLAQAFGGKQLERAILALEIDRAHLGHHVAGHLMHDLVEAGLSVRRLGHDLAQPAHDDAQAGAGRTGPYLIASFALHGVLLDLAASMPTETALHPKV